MSQINGVVIGNVTSTADPLKQGRIKVRYPWLSEEHETDWIRIATVMGGKDRGTFFVPEVEDEVLLGFDHGDVRFPYVLGFMWNGKDNPPAQDVKERIIRSKNGHSVRFLDATPSNGSLGALVIEDGHGNRIVMSAGKIVIQAKGILQLDAAQIVLQGPGFTRVVAHNNNNI